MKQEEDYQFSKPRQQRISHAVPYDFRKTENEAIEKLKAMADEPNLSKPRHISLNRSLRNEPLEDTYKHATEKQINFIEILRNDLGMSLPTRNAHIASIVGKFQNDIWALSRSEASQVIEKFKLWKEERAGK